MCCREGGLHLDLRRLDKVELVHNNNTAVRLGPGSSWERVLGLVPQSSLSLVHGQCTGVGVGGFLLGGGVHAPGKSARYGLGSDNVIAATMVTAEARAGLDRRTAALLDETTTTVSANHKCQN